MENHVISHVTFNETRDFFTLCNTRLCALGRCVSHVTFHMWFFTCVSGTDANFTWWGFRRTDLQQRSYKRYRKVRQNTWLILVSKGVWRLSQPLMNYWRCELTLLHYLELTYSSYLTWLQLTYVSLAIHQISKYGCCNRKELTRYYSWMSVELTKYILISTLVQMFFFPSTIVASLRFLALQLYEYTVVHWIQIT